MSDPDSIEELERCMAEAVQAEDYEAAALLRDRLTALRGGVLGSYFKRQTPGAMGLGTDQQAYQPPKTWTRPKKPDPMTSGHKPGGRRRK
jgi:hypothetical protein